MPVVQCETVLKQNVGICQYKVISVLYYNIFEQSYK